MGKVLFMANATTIYFHNVMKCDYAITNTFYGWNIGLWKKVKRLIRAITDNKVWYYGMLDFNAFMYQETFKDLELKQ